MTEFLTYMGAGFIITIAAIGLLSNFFFPLFLNLNDEINERFKEDDVPSK
jgi:hypothetical protein|tara:strand:- start:168 stop:317 length:150 start_codon:yes stop_codon:yes gene_type:complete